MSAFDQSAKAATFIANAEKRAQMRASCMGVGVDGKPYNKCGGI